MGEIVPYQDQVNFNVLHYPPISEVTEALPQDGQPERRVALCRCWQSRKYPYCDGAHKAMVQNGDNVGPFIAVLRSKASMKEMQNNSQRQQQLQKMNQQTRTALRVGLRAARGSAVLAGLVAGSLGGYVAADFVARSLRQRPLEVASPDRSFFYELSPSPV
ncbi:uncharacterized protein LOC34622627 [Cyclospora cayetanensis]|uniref:Uncharacterized protein n=2 Tax=Cyclospora cayetanensis TaxID=88456 RepID=A0A1D3D3F7_9EIME|nr:uncharacterized protein LOC34622627 [Cyclospora cayetanensis]OEH77994.1 hypothetical protein cyc_06470 [Cyclospora cayetanensis]